MLLPLSGESSSSRQLDVHVDVVDLVVASEWGSVHLRGDLIAASEWENST